MALVIDASVTACWMLPDEEHRTADEARSRLLVEEGFVPSLLWFEIRNLLLMAERRGRIDEDWTANALEVIAGSAIVIDREPDGGRMFDLARKHRLTFYDAAYLELALRKDAPLATLDAALAAAAREAGVALL